MALRRSISLLEQRDLALRALALVRELPLDAGTGLALVDDATFERVDDAAQLVEPQREASPERATRARRAALVDLLLAAVQCREPLVGLALGVAQAAVSRSS